MTLGKRISALRRERGLSQEAVAESLGVSRQAVSKWENDLSSPDTENLIVLAQLFDVDINLLVREDGEESAAPEAEKKEKKPFRWRNAALVLSMCAAIVFCILWQTEKRDRSEMELLCRASAVQCLDDLRDYSGQGSQVSFSNALGNFRAFMQSYHLLTEGTSSSGNYLYLNEVYGSMVCAPEKIDENLDALIGAMKLLSEDIYDYTGHNMMYDLYIDLRHG